MEQPQQHCDDLEDLHALVLVDVVELGRGMQLARHDRVVEVRLDVRIGQVVELDRPLVAEADQVEEAVRSAVGRVLEQLVETLLELLLELLALIRRQRASWSRRKVSHSRWMVSVVWKLMARLLGLHHSIFQTASGYFTPTSCSLSRPRSRVGESAGPGVEVALKFESVQLPESATMRLQSVMSSFSLSPLV